MSQKTMAARIQYLGGNQSERIKKNKLQSFKWALKNDYNSRMIEYNGAAWPCLINTQSGGLKADYDKKIISVGFDSGLKAGKTFRLLEDNSHWMIYLPIITETAYLRSEIIKCRYTLDVNGKTYWVYIQGPSETDLRWFIKNKINVNELNLSGTVYIENNEETKNFFKRFTRIMIDGHKWEVQVTDSISVPGIIELEIQEYYDNIVEDLPEIRKSEDTPLNVISGDTVVKQDTVIGYGISAEAYDPNIHWEVKNNPRVKIEEELDNGRICKVRVYPGAVRTFDICYGEQYNRVTIDWQKPIIQGPQEVYPYDEHTYWIKHKEDEVIKAEFSIDKPEVAEIVDSGWDYCKVNIKTGKKDMFVIHAAYDDIETDLPVKIKSF